MHQPQDKVKSRLLLDIVVGERTTILELLTRKNQALLVWGNAVEMKLRMYRRVIQKLHTPPYPGFLS